jgi:hypothetical protein
MEQISINGRLVNKYDVKIIDGEEIHVLTEKYSNYLRRKEIENKLRLSNIFSNPSYSLDDYKGTKSLSHVKNIKKYIGQFDSKFFKHSLYIWSSVNSTQKSTLSKNIIYELIKSSNKKDSCYFILMQDLANSLANRQFNEEDENLCKKLEAVDLLVIDDCFDPKKMKIYKSGHQIPFLDSFFRKRMEQNSKACVFTSNFSPDEIDIEIFGRSLQKLIKRNVESMEFIDHINEFDVESIFA